MLELTAMLLLEADAADDIRGGGPLLLSFLPPLEELELVGGRETGVELLDD